MRELLAGGLTYQPGGSDPELQMIRTLRAAGATTGSAVHRAARGKTYKLDGAFPAYKVGVEYQGFDYHIGRTAFDQRYERDRLLKRARWHIVYVTSRTAASRIVSDTLEALTSRGWPGPPRLPNM